VLAVDSLSVRDGPTSHFWTDWDGIVNTINPVRIQSNVLRLESGCSIFMATSRKQALKGLLGLLPQVEKHLRFIAEQPENQAIHHWRHEIRTWLTQMEERLPHVGKKTAAEWRNRIQAFRDALGE
jgi:hypothetical protein